MKTVLSSNEKMYLLKMVHVYLSRNVQGIIYISQENVKEQQISNDVLKKKKTFKFIGNRYNKSFFFEGY